MSHCVKGYNVPRCLQEQKPETVVARAMHLLAPDPLADAPSRAGCATGDLERAIRTS
jgi:hypothetical protein